MTVVRESYDNFSAGVITSAPSDQLPATASPAGRNSRLVNIGNNIAIPGVRGGFTLLNNTGLIDSGSGNPTPVLAMYCFRKEDGTSYNLIFAQNDSIRYISGTTISVIGGSATWNSGGSVYPDVAVANDTVFMTDANGGKKIRITSVTLATAFGFAAPPAPALSLGAGVSTGDWEIALTYRNSQTNHESSRGEAAVISAGAGASITIVWTSPADSQCDKVRVHVRKPSLGTIFVYSGTEVDASALTTSIDLTDAAYNNLIIPSPTTQENNPPPSSARYVEFHRSRLFVATETLLYPSGVTADGTLPESFDPDFALPINPSDGQRIRGLLSLEDVLLVFKENSIWALVGDDPSNWTVRLVAADVGTTAHRSIVVAEDTAFFWSEQGPMAMRGLSKPVAIGQILLNDDIAAVSHVYSPSVCATVDIREQRVLFAVTDNGFLVNNRLISYNYRVNAFESNRWDPPYASALGVFDDSNGVPAVHLGSYLGRIYQYGTQGWDGPATGTQTGTFVAAGSSTSSITGTGFFTTGNALLGIPVFVVSSTGAIQRTVVATVNTSTTLTLSPSVDTTTGATYTYYIGGIDFRWTTRWSHFERPFNKKRFEYVHLELLATDDSHVVSVDMQFDYNTGTGQTDSMSVDTFADAATWDVSLWDASSWGSQGRVKARLRVGRPGNAYQLTVRTVVANAGTVIHNMMVRAVMMGEKT